jgi:hypothetical protein
MRRHNETRWRLAALLLCLATCAQRPAFAATSKVFGPGGEGVSITTVAGLPPGAAAGTAAIVTDAQDKGDCLNGGGVTVNLCVSTGIAWADEDNPAAAEAGGSDTQIQVNNAGSLAGVPGFTFLGGTGLTFPGLRWRIDANGDLVKIDSNGQLFSAGALPLTLGTSNHQGSIDLRGGNTLSAGGVTVATLIRANTSNKPGGVGGVTTPAADVRGWIINGISGQTANLLELRVNDSLLAAFDAAAGFTGNAATATALAADPDACPGGDFVTDIAANGALTCDTPPGAGGGSSEISDLTDLKVTRDADTGILNIAAGRARFGNTLYAISAATLELDDASTTGDAEIFVGQDGTLTVAHTPGMTVVCTGCTAGGGGAGIPQTAIPLARWSSASSGVWDASGTERRGFSNGIIPVNGAGLGASDLNGVRTFSLSIDGLTGQADPADADKIYFERDSDNAPRKMTIGELKTEIGAGGDGTPAGSGTEIQYRFDASNFGAIPGSSFAANFLELFSGDTNPAASLVKNSSITGDIQAGVNGSGYGWLSTATNHNLRLGRNFNWRIILPASGGSVDFLDFTDQTKIMRLDLSSLATATTRAVQPPTADGLLFSLGMTLDVSANTNLGATSPIALSGDDVTCPTCEVTGNKDQLSGYLGMDANGDATVLRDLYVTRNLTVGDGESGTVIAAPAGSVDDVSGSLVLEEGANDPGDPAAGEQRLYLRAADSRPVFRDENSVVDPVVRDSDVRWAPTLSLMGALSTGDAQACTIVPPAFAGYTGWVLVRVSGRLLTADTTGINFQVAKVEGATPVNMLSTAFTTDAGETLGSDATTPAVIDTAEDDVLPEDLVCLDGDAADDGETLSLALEFAPL